MDAHRGPLRQRRPPLRGGAGGGAPDAQESEAALSVRERAEQPAAPADTPTTRPGPEAADPDLVVTKTADRPVAGLGEKVTFTVRVENRGTVAAEDVVLADQPGLGERPVAARARGRPCTVRRVTRRVYVCRLGNLDPGETRVFEIDMLVTRSSGVRVSNFVAVGSATAESNVRNNIDAARVRASRLGCPAGVAASHSVPVFAAC